ncbi:hypothetical protein GCM10010320_68710 [Streptomyces caelestis]|nr:hypothetical protein GCM10010320_68710 [Streptomyces caelestis]
MAAETARAEKRLVMSVSPIGLGLVAWILQNPLKPQTPGPRFVGRAALWPSDSNYRDLRGTSVAKQVSEGWAALPCEERRPGSLGLRPAPARTCARHLVSSPAPRSFAGAGAEVLPLPRPLRYRGGSRTAAAWTVEQLGSREVTLVVDETGDEKSSPRRGRRGQAVRPSLVPRNIAEASI